MTSFVDQSGYARLTAGMIIYGILTVMVFIFHVFIANPEKNIQSPNQVVATPTEIQLFPQSLPILQEVKYALTVTDKTNKTFTVAIFEYDSTDQIINQNGKIIEKGIFMLPAQAQDVISVQISLFDDSNTNNPLWITLLQGNFHNDRAILSFAGGDFLKVSGQFMLATPTDNNSLLNERSGLWFGDVFQNTPKLNLPNLTNGWTYEGWAIIDGQTITTGRFKKFNGRDLFSGFSDTKAPLPLLPGEDFLKNSPVAVFPDLQFPIDLAGQSVMITIEPDYNGKDPTGAKPFAITIFKADIAKLAESNKLYNLESMAEYLPKSTVVLR